MDRPFCQELTLPWRTTAQKTEVIKAFCHQGWVYVAGLDEQGQEADLRVAAYEPQAGVWRELFTGPLEARQDRDAGPNGVELIWRHGLEGVLTLSVQLAGSYWLLRQTAAQPDAPMWVEGEVDRPGALPQAELDPAVESALARLKLRPGARISHWLTQDGFLYATVDDDEYGFALWRTALVSDSIQWQALIERGAERFIHNRQAFALVDHGPWLMIAAGTAPESRWPESGFFDYRGFELLRLMKDSGEWELLCGIPRVSPQGLRLPLTALGPSLGGGRHREWCLLHSQGGKLWVGTQDEEGFKLWHSLAGEDWQVLSDPSLALIHQVKGAEMLGCAEREALLVIDGSELGEQSITRLWLLDLG